MLDQYDCPSFLRLLRSAAADRQWKRQVPSAHAVAIASAKKAFADAGASDKLDVNIPRRSPMS
jgi:hypothetical protein